MVKIGQLHSFIRLLTIDVPQGSILGPLLFVAFSSDLAHYITNRKAFFADGTKLYANQLTNHASLQNDLDYKSHSSIRLVTSCISQGSVLEPLLFVELSQVT